MFNKKLLFCFVIVLLHTISFSQVKLSPGVEKGYPVFGGGIFSVMVNDTKGFQKRYEAKVSALQGQSGAKSFHFKRLDRWTMEEMKSDSNILFIDYHQKPKEEASLDHVNSNFNRITKAHFIFPDKLGGSVKISIKEQSFDTTDIDLKNRSFNTTVTPSTSSQHATNMATLIAGGENSSWRAEGVAPLAHITSSDFTTLAPDDISVFTSNNIHLQNHSYGVGIENYYGIEAMEYDQQVYQNPTLLHVFSSGNSGQSMPASGTYQNMLFANLTGNFKQSKNALVVNAVDTTLLINTLNSRGPAFDGRIKPELTAFGQDGTSEAAALGTGISALVQEKYVSSYGALPDASMIKAILIASADDIGSKGVDYLYGYGSINAYRALKLIELGQTTKVTLASNNQLSVPISIPSSISAIKIAVTWSDPAAAVNATSVLINDIDSWLDDGSNITYPWVLNPYPKSDSLLALPKRKQDHLNNVEYITLDNPVAGSYQLVLNAGNLAASQVVSIAYWMDELVLFNWDFPDSTQSVESGNKSLLVWEAAQNQTGDLFLQINQGSWQLIKNGIDLNKYFYWTPPAVLAKAKLKMAIGSSEFISDEFVISPELNLTTAFNCQDSIGLVWNSSPTATNYEIYTMGTEYLKKVLSTPDTLKVLPTTSSHFFSIAPVLNGKTGLKSRTINYLDQGALCYLNFFDAARYSATEVLIQLRLSSWHNLDHVIIYRTINGTKKALKTITPSEVYFFFYYDTDVVAGERTYQAELFFSNGLMLFSDPVMIPFEGEGKAIIYPNPVASSQSDLNILSAGSGIFRILDQYGRIVFEKQLRYFEDAIDVVGLPAGLYVYQMLSAGIVTDTGRFVKY